MADLLSDEDVGIRPAGTGGTRALLSDVAVGIPSSQAPDSTPAEPPKQRRWADVPGEALGNIPKSAGDFASAVVQPIVHPVDTAKAMGNILKGLEAPKQMVKVTLPNGQEMYEPREVEETPEAKAKRTAAATAVGDFFAERYGTQEGFKNAIAEDPVGVLADFATVLTAGGAGVARAPGAVGQAAKIAGRVGAAIDPVTAATSAVKAGARAVEPLASNALGFTTGAGTESIRAAGRAGREGGDFASAFTENMRGNVSVQEVVEQAKSALDQIRKERSEAYQAGKANLGKDLSHIEFDDIEQAVEKATEVGKFRGQSGLAAPVTIEPKAAAVVDEMQGLVTAWKSLDPTEYHTPVGIDALKRALGNIRDSTLAYTPERTAADRIYGAVRDELVAAAPGYAKMMEDYAKSSDLLKETTKTFSLGEKATGDTAARKLLSATRNNVQTNYGGRQRLLDALAEHDPTLPAAIAGQSLNALLPRGIVARGGAALTAPASAAALPAFSPRIVGEIVYLGGKALGTVGDVAEALGVTADHIRAAGQGAFQAGRVEEVASQPQRQTPRPTAADVMKAETVDDAIHTAAEMARADPVDVDAMSEHAAALSGSPSKIERERMKLAQQLEDSLDERIRDIEDSPVMVPERKKLEINRLMMLKQQAAQRATAQP